MTLDIANIKHLILDMDGVLWRGETPMPGLVDFFATLDTLEIEYILATNNATRVAAQYTEKLSRFGVQVREERILTSSEATADHLRELYPAGTTVYAVGEAGLLDALQRREFDLVQAEEYIDPDTRTELVVVGMTRYACYPQLASAAYLINHGARFVGTNPDVSIPTEYGPLPGAGAYLALLQAATGVEPLVVGKPGPILFAEAMDRLGGKPDNTAMVGDRLETDIKGAHAAGLYGILLLSGVTGRDKALNGPIRPDLICEDIGDLAGRLWKSRTG